MFLCVHKCSFGVHKVPLVYIDVPLVYMDVPFSFTDNNKGKIRTETRTRPHPRTNKSEELYRFF